VKKFTIIAVSASLVVGSFSPAMAENSRYTYLADWHGPNYSGIVPATVSKTWTDYNKDNVSTEVYLYGVQAYMVGTSNFYSSPKQQLQMQKDTLFGWASVGNTTTAPGISHSWGDLGSGTFRFQRNGATVNANGVVSNCYSDCPYLFNASSVQIFW